MRCRGRALAPLIFPKGHVHFVKQGGFCVVYAVENRRPRPTRAIDLCPWHRANAVFMNVGTQGAIKGAVSAQDLREIGCQIELSNTYHLHLRPGDELVKEMGGFTALCVGTARFSQTVGGSKSFSVREAEDSGGRGHLCLPH